VKISRRTIVFAVAAAATMSLFPAACNKPTEQAHASPEVPGAAQQAPPAAPVGRLVPIEATLEGFKPSTFDAKKGETLTLRFTRTTQSECLKAIAIPDFKVQKDLPMNQPVDVTITPDKEGKVVFQCWMAMVRGTINVTGS
jgi:hypothetical protein